MQSYKSPHYKGEKCIGGKHSKSKISVLVGSNCDGYEKFPLRLIDKSRKTICFDDFESIPMKYVANNKTWMTESMFVS